MMILGTIGALGFDDFNPPEVLGLYGGAGQSTDLAASYPIESAA